MTNREKYLGVKSDLDIAHMVVKTTDSCKECPAYDSCDSSVIEYCENTIAKWLSQEAE